MKAYLLYESRTGTTQKLAENIAAYLKGKGVVAPVDPIDKANKEAIASADILFLGCWTHGLMVFLQHPVKKWVTFARSLDSIENKKVVLFATYKLFTGTMFRKMEKALEGKEVTIVDILKSKNGTLSGIQKSQLDNISNN